VTKEELLEKLPADLRPWAEIWLPVLLSFTEQQIEDFIYNSIGMDWLDSYKQIVEAMTPVQKVAELKLRNAELAKLNLDNAAFVASQQSLLLSILAKALLGLKN